MDQDPHPPHPPTGARTELDRVRASALAELESTRLALQEIRQLRADRSDDDEHDPEGSPLSGEWSRLDARHRAARQWVRDLDDALTRLAAGTYGICERCGRAIAAGRLEAMPTATRCIGCTRSR